MVIDGMHVIVVSRFQSRRLYILCWSELSRRRLLPAVSPAAGHLTTPTVAGLPGLCENFRPTTSKSSPILFLLSLHSATSFVRTVRTRVVGVANVGDSLRRLCSLQHRVYNLLGLTCSLVLGAYEYPLQAADARDYFLQSGPTRPQWAC